MLNQNRAHNHGNFQITPGVITAPATLKTDPNNIGDDTIGLTINFSPSAPAVQSALTVIDKDGSTKVLEVYQSYVALYNRSLGSTSGVFIPAATLNGTITPVCVELPSGCRIYQGSGDPNTAFTGTGRVGDVYLRRDGTTGSYYYICTAAATPGTWSGIA